MMDAEFVPTLWVVMFDRDGDETDPEGPFECSDDAINYAHSMLDDWRWVSYEIEEGDE